MEAKEKPEGNAHNVITSDIHICDISLPSASHSHAFDWSFIMLSNLIGYWASRGMCVMGHRLTKEKNKKRRGFHIQRHRRPDEPATSDQRDQPVDSDQREQVVDSEQSEQSVESDQREVSPSGGTNT
ncbi:hypothetical protein L1987_58710 [Smallanthus sonchifolius]|uniref:Uncharacterized protein n=1 Tax=Smallanthus sonchifolius TaxID=185202 RepID=A0ACB9D3K1_9ASTR|nr:hypothetical protein L1987_58710 [Smallanthus sonchifolius]